MRQLAIKLVIFYSLLLFVGSGLSLHVLALTEKEQQANKSSRLHEYQGKIARKKAKAKAIKVSREKMRKVQDRTYSSTTNKAGPWDNLAKCESSGSWNIDTGNGYYGGLQFKLSSWQLVGGDGYPHHATKAEQIERAKKLKSYQGWKAWPECSKKLRLR